MDGILKSVSAYIGYIVAIVTGLTAIYGWVVRPLKRIDGRIEMIEKQNGEQNKKLAELDKDMADSLCSTLTREHDYYLKQGWCPATDKHRLDMIYTRYKSRGRNHVSESYMRDIIALPEHKVERTIKD